ncbi:MULTISPECIES: nitroreductase family protein [unclassified Paenibacillus]|uniref:nitroreductase family protein n=1 Tax=unclassified Paenibacillus TaxID=185978 RepID=UPI001AE3810D|nr:MULTISPECIES: nitroreductase family protein [unclassified Paenibacillus]MBP1153757.1 nitroreductase [Paenibacillus sp. PvP091]MBP1170858.1 nitroreductase [Paenibacillus sp. PvR098]MBP2441886.1 nitroreductase [Paenibacillus sp. PvP052]
MYVKDGLYSDFMDVVKHRRAVRGYQTKPVSDEIINSLLESARWGPSGANSQPWEFIVVKDPEMTRKIGEIYVDYYDRQYLNTDPGFPVDSKRWMLNVPVYLIPLVDPRLKRAYPQIEDRTCEEILHHSVGGALLLVWLAATTFGLATTSASTFQFHRDRLKELFDIPDGFDIPCTLPIGYPVNYQQTRYRHDKEMIVHEGTYDRSRWLDDEQFYARMDLVRRSRYRGDGQLIPAFGGTKSSDIPD